MYKTHLSPVQFAAVAAIGAGLAWISNRAIADQRVTSHQNAMLISGTILYTMGVVYGPTVLSSAKRLTAKANP